VKSTFIGGICVVGRGRWGTSLVAGLRDIGVSVLPPGSIDAEVYWVCVPDARIEQVARRLATTLAKGAGTLKGRVFLHSSGVYGSALLEKARVLGAQVGSVHPLMSFPSRKPLPLAGVPFAVEAEERLRKRLFRLARQLGGKPFSIPSGGKALYHAAAVMASPLLVSLATAAGETAALSGLSKKQVRVLLEPIMQATLHNYFREGGAESFSGPFARGDHQTVSLHLAALRQHPLLSQVYATLALHALEVLPVENKARLLRVLKTASKRG
jgi:predicted short-subunit dehydrogenase-like oxidoreductase (DUF2520 family)